MANFEMPVRAYMSSPVATVPLDGSLAEADTILRKQGISALGVTDDKGSLAGVLSRTDLLRRAEYRDDSTFVLPDEKVERLMRSPAITVNQDEHLSSAARTMLKHKIHRVFVTNGNELVGVLSSRDAMRAVRDKRVKTPINAIASTSIVTVKASQPIAVAFNRLDLSNKHGLIVVEEEFPVGIFDQGCALRYRDIDATTPVEQVMNLRILSLPDELSVSRAAAHALMMNVRRILLQNRLGLSGIVSGLDFVAMIAKKR